MAFVIPNRNRDKKFAEGDERYNPNVITYEDITDKQNLHFRYNSESSISSRCESSLTSVGSVKQMIRRVLSGVGCVYSTTM